MSVWSNHECFDHLPDRDPTDPRDPADLDPLEQLACPQEQDEWEALGPTYLMTDAEIQAALAGAPESPAPTDGDLELMEAYYARHWRWDLPF